VGRFQSGPAVGPRHRFWVLHWLSVSAIGLRIGHPSNNDEGRALRPALRRNAGLARCYQLPPVGQPPLPAVVQVRVVEPSSFFSIVKTLVDFDVAVTL
jgi:hypothetical protein